MAGSPATSAAEATPANERTAEAARVGGVAVAGREPLDHHRRHDDRADRDVPARAVHRPRELDGVVVEPREEGARRQGLFRRASHRDRCTEDGAGSQAAAEPLREVGGIKYITKEQAFKIMSK